ncbi:PqqD family peptide modification chaperone [Kocuria sp.]|uniref:PqqD family peptide modification chaperone n=1 Tax=Kocuria sp. TaxID=1871328 RepID=UPI0026DD7519|nr:PqqD family peptide modification chaperone [Kocuria sp.]MDO4919676.1 PqqD family peptide modification chaperone [Kocuria sp.]
MDRSDIPLGVRVELAHAEIQATARAHHVDALLVKGYAAAPGLYAPGRISSDVDALVHPEHAQRMVEALRSRGWETVSTFRSGSLFRHAQTMRHPSWGLVDVHRSFPGFELAPGELFDRLWSRRVRREIAAFPCDVPATLDHALVILVHAARSPESRQQDVGHLSEVLNPEDWRLLEERARELSASVAHAAATGHLARYRDHPSHDLWLVLSQEGSRSQEWRARMRAATTPWGKLRVALRAPLPNVDHLRMDLEREPTVVDIARATLARPATAVRDLVGGRARRRVDAEGGAASSGVTPDPHTAESPGPDPSPTAPTLQDQASAGESSWAHGDPPGDVRREQTGSPSSWLVRADEPGEEGSEVHRASPPGTLRPAPDVAAVELPEIPEVPGSGGVCLARVPGGRPLVLNDSAALIWSAALNVPENEVVDAVARTTGQEPETVRPDVLRFTSSLVTQGFLRRG